MRSLQKVCTEWKNKAIALEVFFQIIILNILLSFLSVLLWCWQWRYVDHFDLSLIFHKYHFSFLGAHSMIYRIGQVFSQEQYVFLYCLYSTILYIIQYICLSGVVMHVCVFHLLRSSHHQHRHRLRHVKVQRNLARYCKEGSLSRFLSLSHTHRHLYQLFVHLRSSSFSPPTKVAGASSAPSDKT